MTNANILNIHEHSIYFAQHLLRRTARVTIKTEYRNPGILMPLNLVACSHSAEQTMLRYKNRLQICLRPHQLHAARQPPVHARLIRKQSHSLMRQHSLHLRLA